MKKIFFAIQILSVVQAVFLSGVFGFADDEWQLNYDSPELSEEEEIELGKKVDEYLSREFYFDTDAELNKKINDITQLIVAVSERKTLPYICSIIQSYSINAFSSPGGHIYITNGLLQLTKTEDELACIIGHEVAHASLRHASKFHQELRNIFSQQDNVDESAIAKLLLKNHLREFEKEADITGVLYAYKAGYDPNGLPDFLERHLGVVTYNGMLGIFGMEYYVKVIMRINNLRGFIATLKDEW
ncbi:MAG: M48 family metalloprotease [Candidatus Kuenenia sp.]|nr:M48 family metalloprotease [Candidatus Kuenenia hertensis]